MRQSEEKTATALLGSYNIVKDITKGLLSFDRYERIAFEERKVNAMTDNTHRLSENELEMVSGGKHHDWITHLSCPDGVIEMKWNLDHFPPDRKPKHGCPVCGGNLREQKFWFQDTGRLFNGFICERDDTHRWIVGEPI